MKKGLFIFGLIAFFSLGMLINLNYSLKSENCLIAGRGCCSSHGGVCGCSNGRTRCCDGTLSPTCQCFMDENKGLQL